MRNHAGSNYVNMPFPLAHPAAVWPLRHACSQRLIPSALVIGSLVPDVAYAFPQVSAVKWSHSFWLGCIGFNLPVGLALFWSIRTGFRTMVKRCPTKIQTAFDLNRSSAGVSWPALIASLLIGAWTHVILDAITHADGWIAVRLPVLQGAVFQINSQPMRLCDLLYYVFTFFGFAYLTFCFLRWIEKARGPSARLRDISKWAFAFLLSGLLLFACALNRGAFRLPPNTSRPPVTAHFATSP